jgi:hypothetical protein
MMVIRDPAKGPSGPAVIVDYKREQCELFASAGIDERFYWCN